MKNLQYVLSTVELYLVLYCGLTSLFFSLSESLAVGCVQYSLLHLTQPNTYVAKAQPRCPPAARPPSPKTSSQRHRVMHVVSDILPGRDLKLTFLSGTANHRYYTLPEVYSIYAQINIPKRDRHVRTYARTHVRTYIARIDPSFRASR